MGFSTTTTTTATKNGECNSTTSEDHQQQSSATTKTATEDSNKAVVDTKEETQQNLQIEQQQQQQQQQNQNNGDDDDDDDDDEDNSELLEDPERRLTFFDAAVAIILTLLVLPLMDSANEDVLNSGTSSEAMSATEWFKENAGRFFTFLISFAVVASEWEDHARLIGNLKYITRRIRKCLWYWLLTLVFIPVTSILIHIDDVDSATAAPYELFIYMGNIILLKIINIVIVLLVRRKMDLLYKENKKDVTSKLLSSFIVDTFLLGLAIPLSLTRMGYYSLLLMIAEPYLTILWMSTKCAIPPAPRKQQQQQQQ
jgi:uncharacterized membrane protein